MFIMLYCCLLVRVQPLFLAWANLHHTDSLWALFEGPIVESRLGYPIFYLGIIRNSPPNDDLKRQLHQAQWKQSPSNSNVSSNDEEDTIYRQRSKNST